MRRCRDTRVSDKKEDVEDNKAHMDTQFEIDTTKAVPTPRFDVGEKFAAAQLLQPVSDFFIMKKCGREIRT